ncbi:hypothetical protein [Acrocarpospora sp. B8E8]|uniref:hypothetical protein n=1 Tax=Acrocarpospora sp. B8E8 TaxID=3153572 RepID=UPI00325E269D
MSDREIIPTLDLLTYPNPESLLPPKTQEALTQIQSVIASPNTVGMGIAHKVRRGEVLDKLAIAFYVKQKKGERGLRRSEHVPRWIPSTLNPLFAIATDVVELGEIVPQASVARIVRPGHSISHILSSPGTLGAIVDLGGSKGLLSNSHVLALSGRAHIGDAIIYPSRQDGGESPNDVVGKLLNFQRFAIGGEFVNTADCAVASLTPGFTGQLSPSILGVGIPTGTTKPTRGMEVVKLGRTTGLTKAIVRDVNFRFVMNYREVGLVGFRDQVLCTLYSSGGDSGSLVLESKTKKAVGLHFAGSTKGSIFSPIDVVLRELGVRLLS